MFASPPHLSGLRSVQQRPAMKVVVLGTTPLLGALTGLLAIELGASGTAAGSKLWTLYSYEPTSLSRALGMAGPQPIQQAPYARLCADAPPGATEIDDWTYWINPHDPLTRAAGIGSEWLIPIETHPKCGLILARINRLMVTMETLQDMHYQIPQLQEAYA